MFIVLCVQLYFIWTTKFFTKMSKCLNHWNLITKIENWHEYCTVSCKVEKNPVAGRNFTNQTRKRLISFSISAPQKIASILSSLWINSGEPVCIVTCHNVCVRVCLCTHPHIIHIQLPDILIEHLFNVTVLLGADTYVYTCISVCVPRSRYLLKGHLFPQHLSIVTVLVWLRLERPSVLSDFFFFFFQQTHLGGSPPRRNSTFQPRYSKALPRQSWFEVAVCLGLSP